MLTAIGIVLLVAAMTMIGGHYLGHGQSGRALSSAPLPAGLGPVPTAVPSPARSHTGSRSAVPVVSRPAVRHTIIAGKPGVPVSLQVESHQVQAAVSANRLNRDGSLYVPPDPRAVSWASQDVGPGSAYGTTILVAHVNYNGVAGVFSDLADYRVGQVITLVMADKRKMKYAVAAAPMEVNKNQVSARRQELFDQTHSYGVGGQPKSGRLLLLSCGGVFDNRTGHYESNIFVYALPI